MSNRRNSVTSRLIGFGFLVILGGCASSADDNWEIRPGEMSDSIAIEQQGYDVVCVRELDSTGVTTRRTCVPVVDAGTTESGEVKK